MKKLEAKRKLRRFNFEDSGSHVALVGPSVGGAANQWTTLKTKSTNDITLEQLQESLSQVDKDLSSQEGVTNQTEGNSLSDINKEDIMSEEMVAKSFMEAEIEKAVQKAVDEAVAKAVEDKDKELVEKQAELTKAQDVVKALEEEKKQSVEKARKEVLKQAGVAEDEVEDLYKSMEALSPEAFEKIAKKMASDKKAVEESDLFKEKGVSGVSETVEKDGVEAYTEALQKKYSK